MVFTDKPGTSHVCKWGRQTLCPLLPSLSSFKFFYLQVPVLFYIWTRLVVTLMSDCSKIIVSTLLRNFSQQVIFVHYWALYVFLSHSGCAKNLFLRIFADFYFSWKTFYFVLERKQIIRVTQQHKETLLMLRPERAFGPNQSCIQKHFSTEYNLHSKRQFKVAITIT